MLKTREIDGIVIVKKKNYSLCRIENFSEEMQKLLREHLSYICYGISSAASGKKIYSYKSTLIEFRKRYENKSENTKMGMLGELLIHLIVRTFFDEYIVASPFFNLQERSIKKGFDVVLSSKSGQDIWLIEIKSGELHVNKGCTETTIDLINTAKYDLIKRLNNENHSLWINAVADAKYVFDNNQDSKKMIVDLLEKYCEFSNDEKVVSNKINVFLSSSLFSNLKDNIDEIKIRERYATINKENIFKSVYILSIHKETFTKLINFIECECMS